MSERRITIAGRDVVVTSQEAPPCAACGAEDHGAYKLGPETWMCGSDLNDAMNAGSATSIQGALEVALAMDQEDDR